MEFVRFHAMQTSVELARARGPFPAIQRFRKNYRSYSVDISMIDFNLPMAKRGLWVSRVFA
jgi:ribonucleotide reductase alpha subunit